MIANFTEAVWDTDLEVAINRVAADKAALRDPEYFIATVSLVEDGSDPETKSRITMSGLARWVARCQSAPDEEAPSNASTPRRLQPTHRAIPDAAP